MRAVDIMNELFMDTCEKMARDGGAADADPCEDRRSISLSGRRPVAQSSSCSLQRPGRVGILIAFVAGFQHRGCHARSILVARSSYPLQRIRGGRLSRARCCSLHRTRKHLSSGERRRPRQCGCSRSWPSCAARRWAGFLHLCCTGRKETPGGTRVSDKLRAAAASS